MFPLAFCAVLWYIKSSMNGPKIGQKLLFGPAKKQLWNEGTKMKKMIPVLSFPGSLPLLPSA